MIRLPDPALHDSASGVLLRPWGTSAGDAEVLAAAWADPDVGAETEVPEDRSVAAAERWIAGEADRRQRSLALDLVIADVSASGRRGAGNQVLGEVGLAHFDEAGRVEIGFWLLPEARGRGVAALAVGLVTTWALSSGGLGRRQVWARIRPNNSAAAKVLGRAGFSRLGEVVGRTIFSAVAPGG